MKNTGELAKLIITAFFAPTACFVAILGSIKGDGSQVVLGVAFVTAISAMWGFPTKSGRDDDATGKGGSHAA